MQTRDPSTQRLIQPVQQDAVSCTPAVPHLQGYSVQKKCRDSGALLCAHVRIVSLRECVELVKCYGTCMWNCPVQRKCGDSGALLHAYVGYTTRRKYKSSKVLWYTNTEDCPSRESVEHMSTGQPHLNQKGKEAGVHQTAHPESVMALARTTTSYHTHMHTRLLHQELTPGQVAHQTPHSLALTTTSLPKPLGRHTTQRPFFQGQKSYFI